MWDSDSDESDSDSFPSKQGVKRNVNGGYYEPERQYDLCKKVRVAELYLFRSKDEGGEVDLTYLSVIGRNST